MHKFTIFMGWYKPSSQMVGLWHCFTKFALWILWIWFMIIDLKLSKNGMIWIWPEFTKWLSSLQKLGASTTVPHQKSLLAASCRPTGSHSTTNAVAPFKRCGKVVDPVRKQGSIEAFLHLFGGFLSVPPKDCCNMLWKTRLTSQTGDLRVKQLVKGRFFWFRIVLVFYIRLITHNYPVKNLTLFCD